MTVTPYKIPRSFPPKPVQPSRPEKGFQKELAELADGLEEALSAYNMELEKTNRHYADLVVEIAEQRDQAKDDLVKAKVLTDLMMSWFSGDCSTAQLRRLVGNLLNAQGIKNPDE